GGALDPEYGLFDVDPAQPEFTMQQWKQCDPEPGPPRRSDHNRVLIEDPAVFQCDMQAREDAHLQPACNANVHTQGVGGGRLQSRLVAIDVHKQEGGQDNEQQESNGTAS